MLYELTPDQRDTVRVALLTDVRETTHLMNTSVFAGYWACKLWDMWDAARALGIEG